MITTAPGSGNLVVPFRGPAVTPALSPAETRLFRLLAQGLTQKEAAHRLGRSPHTVRYQTAAVYERIGVSGLAQALWALGWVRLP